MFIRARSRPDTGLCTVFSSASAPLTARRHRSSDRGENFVGPDRWYGHRFQSCATLTPFSHPRSGIRARRRVFHYMRRVFRPPTVSLFHRFLFSFSSFLFPPFPIFSALFSLLFFNARTYLASGMKNARSLDDITSGIRRCQNDGVAHPARRTLLQSE